MKQPASNYDLQVDVGKRIFQKYNQDVLIRKFQIETALKRCGMTDFFDAIFTCSEIGHGKDEPVIFRKAMEFLGTDRNNTVIFEDALHAVQTAKADGFLTVGVSDPYIREQEDLQKLCDCYLSDFGHTEPFWNFAAQQ